MNKSNEIKPQKLGSYDWGVKEFEAPNKKKEKSIFDGLITEYWHHEVVRVL